MLRMFKTASEQREAVKLAGPLSEFLSLRAVVKHKIAGRLPGTAIEIGAYPWPDVKCWIMIMRNTLAE